MLPSHVHGPHMRQLPRPSTSFIQSSSDSATLLHRQDLGFDGGHLLAKGTGVESGNKARVSVTLAGAGQRCPLGRDMWYLPRLQVVPNQTVEKSIYLLRHTCSGWLGWLGASWLGSCPSGPMGIP